MTTAHKNNSKLAAPMDSNDTLTIYAQLLRGELEGDTALRASQQMLQMIFDTIPQAIWWKDRDCVFLGVNRVLADLADLEPEEMIGKSDFDMPWASGKPYGAAWYQECDREVMESGIPRYGIKEELTMPDGTNVWIETNKVPLRDFSGEVIGILGNFQDVTKRHIADEARIQALTELDERVKARTSDLRKANEALRREVEDRILLEAQERKQRGYAEALRDTAAAVAESLDLDEVLEQVLLGVDRLIKHHLAAVVLTDDDGAHTLAQTRVNSRDQVVSGIETGTRIDHLPLIADMEQTEGPLIRNDLPEGGLGDKTHSAIGAPITVSDTRIGYLVVESISPGFFDTNHTERLTAIADLAAAAISNAQLFSAEAELAALEERQHLARELHDAVSQTLWTTNIVSNSISASGPAEVTEEQLERLRTLTRGSLAEMRGLLLELRPASLVETQFTELLDQLVDALQSRRAIKAMVHSPATIDQWEPVPTAKHALYRIAQEALNNVARHSGATEVEIDVTVAENRLVMTICDNGQGFSAQDPKADRLGLSIMKERAEAVGAVFELHSVPGSGTTISVLLPIEHAISPR
jgi:PAS domain S-box-containing protein